MAIDYADSKVFARNQREENQPRNERFSAFLSSWIKSPSRTLILDAPPRRDRDRTIRRSDAGIAASANSSVVYSSEREPASLSVLCLSSSSIFTLGIEFRTAQSLFLPSDHSPTIFYLLQHNNAGI